MHGEVGIDRQAHRPVRRIRAPRHGARASHAGGPPPQLQQLGTPHLSIWAAGRQTMHILRQHRDHDAAVQRRHAHLRVQCCLKMAPRHFGSLLLHHQTTVSTEDVHPQCCGFVHQLCKAPINVIWQSAARRRRAYTATASVAPAARKRTMQSLLAAHGQEKPATKTAMAKQSREGCHLTALA